MKFVKRLFILLITFCVGAGWGSVVNAQSGHFSAASLGMGGTGTAYLDTYHANFVNPANLMLNSDTKPSTSIGLLGGVSATAGGPLANISVYNNYFTTGDVVNTDAALDAWFGSQASATKRLGAELDIIPFGGSWRGESMSLSLAFRNRTLYEAAMNRGYANLMLGGISRDDYGTPKPVNFSSKAVIFTEVSAGVSLKLLELPVLPGLAKNVKIYAGAAPKYIIPQHTSSINFNSTLQVTDSELVHDFQYTFQTVGGLTSQFTDYYQASQSDNFDGSLGDFVKPEGSDFTEIQNGSGFGLDLGATVDMDLAGPAAALFSWIDGPKKLRIGASVTDLGAMSYDKEVGSFSANETFTWDGAAMDDLEGDYFETLADSVSKEIYLNYQPGNKEKIKEKLPTKVHLGGQLQLGKLAVALDLEKGLNEAGMNSKRVAVAIGAEYKLFNIIPLRAGYRTGGLTSSSITVGTGLELRNFELSFGALTVPNSENRGSGAGGAWSGLVFRF